MHSARHVNIRAMAMKLNLDKEIVRQTLSDSFGMKTFWQRWSHDC
jgi:hypothetical protein